MKRTTVSMVALAALWFFPACSNQTRGGEGGTEIGTTDTGNRSGIGTRFDAAASALVPEISQSAVGSALELAGPAALDYGTDSDWDTYLIPNNAYVLTDVFGSEEEEPRVVTKIRVLLDQFGENLEGLFNQDPEVTCVGSEPLAAEDTLEIAFYGEISNGTAEDRFFDCLGADQAHESGYNQVTLYGEDAAGVIRMVTMSDNTSENTEEVSTRGDQVRILAVVSVTYAEQEGDGLTDALGLTTATLDLQFAHASGYNGPDGVFETADDVVFSSRSRITGRVVLNDSGEPVSANGEFAVTKYDRSANPSGGAAVSVTKTIGRGRYAPGANSLFKIESNADAMSTAPGTLVPGTFCIELSTEDNGLPAHSDSANCSAFESEFAWAGGEDFPFEISPSLDPTFEVRPFFEEADLVNEYGTNFTIPTYATINP